METHEAMEQTAESLADDRERAELLQAVAEGLADDAAGRTMDTRALKQSLEDELGPIARR